MKKNVLIINLILILALIICYPASAGDTEKVRTDIASANMVDKFGNIHLSITTSQLSALGYESADYVYVSFLDQTLMIPIIPTYRYVVSQSAALIMRPEPESNIRLSINNGSFAETYGFAERNINSDGVGYHAANDAVSYPVSVTIEMAEKGGYKDIYAVFELERSNKKVDYPSLSDREFANYRMINTTGIGENKLFRSSSPIDPDYARNFYADKAAEEDQIRSFINLSDTAEAAAGYEAYDFKYYGSQDVLYLNMGVDFNSKVNRMKMSELMEYLADAETPVLIHCSDGQDRTGLVAALLECLMGANQDEIIRDYMISFSNFYGVIPGTNRYARISNNILKSLSIAMGLDTLEGVDLAEAAEDFFKDLGVSDETIAAVKQNLGEASLQIDNLSPETEPEVSSSSEDSWICQICGTENTGKFCTECGHEKGSWICPKCQHINTGKFCAECGYKYESPEAIPAAAEPDDSTAGKDKPIAADFQNTYSGKNEQNEMMNYEDGSLYIGELKNGIRDGNGSLYFENGDIYIGEWKNDKREGHGQFFGSDGEYYDGEWKNDVKSGYGTYTWADGMYEGEFKDNQINGHGIIHYSNGEVYEG